MNFSVYERGCWPAKRVPIRGEPGMTGCETGRPTSSWSPVPAVTPQLCRSRLGSSRTPSIDCSGGSQLVISLKLEPQSIGVSLSS